ncbi:MAG: GTPase HflX [Lachnospiraceae bacterium]|nr:GTPase HflX [Lachnospiraceae bacterium]MDD7048452.1 GTPase HflX [Lachnospiraceae bacterium]
MFENKAFQERAILFAITWGKEEETQISLRELRALAETAGAVTVTSLVQPRELPDPGTYLGRGKLEELREMTVLMDATTVICDDELSPAQMKNLEEELGCKVCDRTLLILDIFAGRARTSEGKIQVELAQLRYRQSRLAGLGKSLSRLGGGIGTRGPGEKKLEMDRRLIADRISALKKELELVKRHRDVLRKGRLKSGRKTAAIVGYTNAGKSTLLNVLTDAGVLEEDALFATLDPTTRALTLPGGSEVLLTDTVGFIRKLPHLLIDAFRSTLEEAALADILIHVVDASSPYAEQQMEIVYQTLRELGAEGKPVITLFNKQDLVTEEKHLHDFHADYAIPVSVRHREGLDRFLEILEQVVRKGQILVERVLPYQNAGIIAQIRQTGQILEEEYLADGIRVRAYVPEDLYGRLQEVD